MNTATNNGSELDTCGKCGMPHPLCHGHNRQGAPCGRPPVRGGFRCPKHGGALPNLAAQAFMRDAVLTNRLPAVDPAAQFARMLSVTAYKQARLDELIHRTMQGPEDMDGEFPEDYRREVMQYIGVKTLPDGTREEYLRVLVQAEARERERLADWSLKAIAAGLDERKVRMLEEQGRALVGVIDQIAAQLGLTESQQERWPVIIAEVLRAVPGAQAALPPGG